MTFDTFMYLVPCFHSLWWFRWVLCIFISLSIWSIQSLL